MLFTQYRLCNYCCSECWEKSVVKMSYWSLWSEEALKHSLLPASFFVSFLCLFHVCVVVSFWPSSGFLLLQYSLRKFSWRHMLIPKCCLFVFLGGDNVTIKQLAQWNLTKSVQHSKPTSSGTFGRATSAFRCHCHCHEQRWLGEAAA